MLTIGVIGKDGRTSAITEALAKSARVVILSEWKDQTPELAEKQVLEKARAVKPDFIIVGPEEPLAHGIVDILRDQLGIPCVGPTQSLARLESSKSFTRDLVAKYGIFGNPRYRVFDSMEGIEEFLHSLDGSYVVKPDGLTGGKGVKVSDAHLFSIDDGLNYCKELLSDSSANPAPRVVIEEKLEGEEFSLMSFCDGVTVKDMIVVQDHKRAYDGDAGPNTGGMGSYSCADHMLPFLTEEDVAFASKVNAAVAKALLQETGEKYKGILYGGFMATANGVRLLEYNARFGDPETMNVLAILETDFTSVCEAIVRGTLHELSIKYSPLATVCKYLVPIGYPDASETGQIDLREVSPSPQLKQYKAAVREEGDQCYLTGSRALAFVGVGSTLAEAEAVAEQAAARVKGPVFHRKDIGTDELVRARVEHMEQVRAKEKIHAN